MQPKTHSWDMLFDAEDLAQPLPPQPPLDQSNERQTPRLSYPIPAQQQEGITDSANLQDGDQNIMCPLFAEMTDFENICFDSFLEDSALLNFTPATGTPTWLEDNRESRPSLDSNVALSNLQPANPSISNSDDIPQPGDVLEDDWSFADRECMAPNIRAPLEITDDVASDL